MSESFYTGPTGEEKASYSFNYNFAGTTVKSRTDYEYDVDGVLIKTTTLRGQLITGSKISETFYKGPEGEEKADYTFNYNFAGTTIKSRTDYAYGAEDELIKTTTRRGEFITGSKMSETFYQGPAGEEKANHTFNYNYLGVSIKSRTDYEYDIEDALVKTTTRRGQLITDSKISETFYFGPAGEEKADYTNNYNYAGTLIKSVTDYTYGAADELIKTVTTRETITGSKMSETFYTGPTGEEKASYSFNYNFAGTTVKSRTDYEYDVDGVLIKTTTLRGQLITSSKMSETFYQGPAGEEKANYTFNYNYLGVSVKSRTDYEYDLEGVLTKTTTRRGELLTGSKMSETFYVGPEGEEKADYTNNYNYAGTLIKSVTDYTYGAEDELIKTVTTRETITGSKMSETFYTGPTGEEKADYPFNYNFAGTTIKSRTDYAYGAEDELIKTPTRRGELITGAKSA